MGSNVYLLPSFYCDYGYNIEIGNNFFANHNLVILDPAKVIIGDNVFLANNVTITTAGHPIDTQMRNEGLEYAYPVVIGDNVWVGANVTIGSNVVIGAGSLVNPCKVLRAITQEDKLKYQNPPDCVRALKSAQ